ncbi:membrane-bound lytic murein transglycosylase MltC [Candidatus Palibaumannia cicadellinicola]|nr:membrane-bound lytic murein transglycosylase MltC [Candidatus Baumannia cicadellinicola]MCJ7462047.1 membrane-bound lytic murein transglycosylase MltC [Candidatus Baumannia cicadellinicola]MCJ7463074.1 membrane-bound lytic murein transglycosylase MltC [Candidatus Baumannia cicadellinicola]
MSNKKKIALFFMLPFLISCYHNNNPLTNQVSPKTVTCSCSLVEKIWGINELLKTGPKNYIKYTDEYQTRSHINFDTGTITIETIANEKDVTINLRKAIINTLLMYINENKQEISTNNLILQKEPFLYGQVIDHYNKPIRWSWRATNFANYLLKTNLRMRHSTLHDIWFITINMVPQHINKRANHYVTIVSNEARKYKIDQSLILAIIQTESSFNPYAISHANAVGLMQIMQNSAGRDVFKMKGKCGQPSRKYLLNPKNNINIGTAYLAMLQNNYLSGIIDLTSRRYVMIVAYNSGVSSALKVFSSNPNKALNMINNLKPDEVYHILSTQHPSAESRNYLNKVNALQQIYGK